MSGVVALRKVVKSPGVARLYQGRASKFNIASLSFVAALLFFSSPTSTQIHFSENSMARASDMVFDTQTTGSITKSDAKFKAKSGAQETSPDYERVNRAQKQGRVVGRTFVAPPKAFNAGSILQRTSSLLRPTLSDDTAMVFTKAKSLGAEIQLAQAFHVKKVAAPEPELPTMLAELANDKNVQISLNAYAPSEPDYTSDSPFESLLKVDSAKLEAKTTFVKGDHAWAKQPMPRSVLSQSEQRCLAAAVYFEARGEQVKGQAAVAQVVLNRVKNPAYPNTVCGVVYQNNDWRNRCQFSFACDGIKDRISEPKHWKQAQEVAYAVASGEVFLPEVGSSTHYHATYVKPKWARKLEKMKKIGTHIFYRTLKGGWS